MAIIVIVWYVGLAFLPQILGTCLDGECDFTIGEIVVSIVTPFVLIALPVVLEMLLYHKTLAQALSDIGVTRFSWTGIRIAVIFLLPLIVFYPLFALLTNSPLSTQPNWPWLLLNVVLVNGLAEELMMRAFVFRHIREGRSFWRAAALATVYFAAYHLVLIFTAGPVLGIIAVIIAIPAGFLQAYIYERGNNTLWGASLGHAVYNAPALILAFPADMQLTASALYLLVGMAVSTLMLVLAYRAGYGRGTAQARPAAAESAALAKPLGR
jgi:membrane protease YdiL (CAAX protease family)